MFDRLTRLPALSTARSAAQAPKALLGYGVLIAICVAAFAPAAGGAPIPVVDPSVPAKRDTEAVILKGRNFPQWAVTSNTTVKLPFQDLADCQVAFNDPKNIDPTTGGASPDTNTDNCAHNHYTTPEADTQDYAPQEGTSVGRLIGYRWDKGTKRFKQIPFQVDEVFTRYLDNSASGFAVYSGQDQHTTYAFQREGFRWTKGECTAEPDSDIARDPVKGLDSNDELVFMASDAGPKAPDDAKLPRGVEDARQVRLADTTNPQSENTYAYVMKAGANGPHSAFNANNGYVKYQRDPTVADIFEKSESSYDNYGNAAKGTVCDKDGNVIRDAAGQPIIEKRRPRDYATITTPRYRYRYDGRWLMTELQIAATDDGKRISPTGTETNGQPDLVDRWKARAFAQDPGSETPCCGFEEEDTNWGGSSILLGELSGPVRSVRETWGADSGTNTVRRESFYRDEVRQKTWLRVHVIPPLDGIYAQWDFNAGRMTRFYTPRKQDGVPIDGRNDEVFGNLDDPCNQNYNHNDTGDVDQSYRQLYGTLSPSAIPIPGDPFGGNSICDRFPYHQSVDISDPTIADANAATQWSVTAGPSGSIVDRIQIDQVEDVNPGGVAQSLAATPYYRDDSCFDDGTGTDPGPKINKRSGNEPQTASDGTARKCWNYDQQPGTIGPLPDGSDHFFQGSVGTHGLHLLFLADSDNARQTMPVDEIVSEWRMVMLPGARNADAGEQYGRQFEKPLLAFIALPYAGGGFESEETQAGDTHDGDSGNSITNADDSDNADHNSTANTGASGDVRGSRGSGGGGPGRGSSRCLPKTLKVGLRGIGPLKLGKTRAQMPTAERHGISSLRYCVKGGGKVLVAFNRAGRSVLVTTTARGHRARGVSRGTPVRTFRRAYPQLRHLQTGLYRTSGRTRKLFGIRRGRVRFVAVADRQLLGHRHQLVTALRAVRL